MQTRISAVNDCALCKISRHEVQAAIVQEDEYILAIMDLYPATRGHMLLMPKQHIEDIYAMPLQIGSRIMETAVQMAKAIREKLSPDGLNLVQSNGILAGQTIRHFHLHLVPRYAGDRVSLRFGHGTVPANVDELAKMGSLIRAGLGTR